MANGVPAQHLPAEAASQLQEGIGLLLSQWTALQMAIENEWGGRDSRQKSHQLASDIFSWFTLSKGPLYIDDLENYLDEFMLSLNTEIGDGSIEEVAEKLMTMHEECLEGNFASIKKLKDNPPRVVPHIRQAANDDNSNDDDSNDDDDDDSLVEDDSSKMMVDAPESQQNSSQKNIRLKEPPRKETAEADDGWTVVAPRRNRGRT